MNDQVKALAEQVYREVKNVEQGFNLLDKNLERPFADETKKAIADCIRSLLFCSSNIIRNLERDGN